jgi:site-specific DNA recombinase
MAKNYIDNLSEEVKKGQHQKALQGEYPSKPPYGYKRNKGEKEIYIVPEQADFVRRAFELYADGFRSLDNVIETLYTEGYIYRRSKPKIHKSMLVKLLMNVFYTGDFMYSGVFYHGKHKALISKETYNNAQKAFRKDNKPETMSKHHFLFSGLLICPKCGSAIVGQIKKGKYIYYSCSDKTKNCPNRKVYVRQEKIEKVFEQAIKNVEITTKQKEAIYSCIERKS